MEELDNTAIKTLLETGGKLLQTIPLHDGDIGVLIPDEYRLKAVSSDFKKLPRVMDRRVMNEAESFCDYINRFKNADSQIFAEYANANRGTASQMNCFIDYHSPVDGGHVEPKHNQHLVVFTPQESEQWKRWSSIHDKVIGQREFAEFIEENYLDVVKPEVAVFFDLITNIQSRRKVSFSAGVRLKDGTNQIAFNEEADTSAKGHIEIPSEFEIGIPVYQGEGSYKVRMLLRTRIIDGALGFIVKMNRRDFVQQTAFKDIAVQVGNETKIKPYMGS